MLDVAHDLRWGRIAEGPGEDPLVAAKFAEAKIRGFQGPDLAARTSVAATAKHFCAGGAATRDGTMRPADLIEAATLSLKADVDIDMLPIPTKAPVYNGIMPPGDSGIMAPPFYEMIPPGRRVH